ncbi:hypothetical protein ASZ90_017373 [hydrocarbon metagenome]|uniref:Uncharacterized protein n=1 Tax=hydrocarbon metagenome TaxID=938273 RepID=A0A0W8E9P1_9ZZZZ
MVFIPTNKLKMTEPIISVLLYLQIRNPGEQIGGPREKPMT